MTKTTMHLHRLASNPITVLISSLASIFSFCWLVYEKTFTNTPGFLSIFAFFGCMTFFLIVGFYSAIIRRREMIFHNIMETIHKINHDYRDILRSMFHEEGYPVSLTEEDRIRAEEVTLRAVCQQIKGIFDRIINRPCMVTIKLITKDDSGLRHCSTYIRSEDSCVRDRDLPRKYEIGNLKNTAFDKALFPNNPGQCSYFHSPNLLKEKDDYNNQRQHWERYYKSTIVVPIRSVLKGVQNKPDEYNDIGFLCVDTMSCNRLNDGYHVHILAAFADQMYNFISLMRGKYVVT